MHGESGVRAAKSALPGPLVPEQPIQSLYVLLGLSIQAILKGETVLASREGDRGDGNGGCERGSDEGGQVNHDMI